MWYLEGLPRNGISSGYWKWTSYTGLRHNQNNLKRFIARQHVTARYLYCCAINLQIVTQSVDWKVIEGVPEFFVNIASNLLYIQYMYSTLVIKKIRKKRGLYLNHFYPRIL